MKQSSTERKIGPDREFVTIPEMAKMTGVSQSELYQLEAKGELDTLRLGRSIFIPIQFVKGFRKPAPDWVESRGVELHKFAARFGVTTGAVRMWMRGGTVKWWQQGRGATIWLDPNSLQIKKAQR